MLNQIPDGIISDFNGQGLGFQAAAVTFGTDPLFIIIYIAYLTQTITSSARPMLAVKRKEARVRILQSDASESTDSP